MKTDKKPENMRPTRQEAEAAVRTLILWAGDNPAREGLRETPGRVVRAYEEFFEGYRQDPEEVLGRTFEEIGGYDEIVMLRDISIESHCEHHMLPVIGKAHIAYIPDGRAVGLSKLARVIEIYARRLQTQETMTADIAHTVNRALKPKGVAVMIEAVHECMTTRGVRKAGVATITTQMLGVFRDNPAMREEFLSLIRNGDRR